MTESAAPRKRRPILRTIGLVVLVAVVTYAAFAIYLATRPVIIAFDAVQKFRDSLPKVASPEDAAWPAYRDALIASGYLNAAAEQDRAERQALGAWPAALAVWPGSDEWSTVAGWVDAHQPTFAAMRSASKRSVLGFPLAQQPSGADAAFFRGVGDTSGLGSDMANPDHFPMFAISLAHLSPLNSVGLVLKADMLRAVEQGDGERATQNLEAMLAVSVHASEGRLLIGDLVGMAIRAGAVRSAIAAIEWRPEVFSDEQLRRMQASLRSVPAVLERIDMTSEQLSFLDAVQRLYSDDGAGDGWFVPTWSQLQFFEKVHGASGGLGVSRPNSRVYSNFVAALRPLGAWLVAGRKDAVARFDEVAQALESIPTATPRQAEAACGDVRARYDLSGRQSDNAARWILIQLFTPASAKAAVNFAIDRAQREMACAAIAAELFHRKAGRWPGSADELAAFLGGQAPADPWIEAPVRMANDDAGFRMWSLGQDGKDEGGRDLRCIIANGRGDWVLFAPRGNLDRWKAD